MPDLLFTFVLFFLSKNKKESPKWDWGVIFLLFCMAQKYCNSIQLSVRNPKGLRLLHGILFDNAKEEFEGFSGQDTGKIQNQVGLQPWKLNE